MVIRDQDSGAVYGRWRDVSSFSVEFVHSVNNSPVRDSFEAVKTGGTYVVKPVETLFYDFGAGMQTELSGREKMRREGDALITSGFDETRKKLYYIVGTVSDHLLFVDGKEVSLRALCGRNAHIEIAFE